MSQEQEYAMAVPLASWNFGWGESWSEYLRRLPITADINRMQSESARQIVGAITDQTKEILLGNDAIANLANGIIEAGHQDAAMLASVFGRGIDTLSFRLDGISEGISALNSTFQWGFGEILASMGRIQDSLDEILRTLKRPSKTYAYEKFEDARDAFKRGLYPECLRLTKVAISGDHMSSGYELEWRFHLLMGIVCLGSARTDPSLIDLPKAESAFLLAARYTDNRDEAAKAMLQAGWAAFVQRKLAEARRHTNEAIRQRGDFGEALYQSAKFAMVANDFSEGIEKLGRAIDVDIGYIIKADTDKDFAPYRAPLLKLFEEKRAGTLRRMLSDKAIASFRLDLISLENLKKMGLLQLLDFEASSLEKFKDVQKKKREEQKRKEDEWYAEQKRKDAERARIDAERAKEAARKELEARLRTWKKARCELEEYAGGLFPSGTKLSVLRENLKTARESYSEYYREFGRLAGATKFPAELPE